MADEQEFWREFLELYKEHPALWKIKSSEYSNRIMKSKAYELLVQKLKEKNPEADRDTVVKKINNFRTNYRKELKKVKCSEKSGAGADDIYEPSLWYYSILSFLEDQETSTPGRSSMDDEEMVLPRSKKKRVSEEDKLIKLACQHLQQERTSFSGDDAIAQGWAFQLKEMAAEQKVIARKLIADVLFYGSVGNLSTFHTVEVPKLLQERSRSDSRASASSYNENTSSIMPDQIILQESPRFASPTSSAASPYNENTSSPVPNQIIHLSPQQFETFTIREFYKNFEQ